LVAAPRIRDVLPGPGSSCDDEIADADGLPDLINGVGLGPLLRPGALITFLRRFSPEYSDLAKNTVVPLLQTFGSVVFVGDRTFESVGCHGLWSVDLNAAPGLLKRSEQLFTDEEWKREVRKMIERSDVAVIDISDLTDNLIWELAQCYEVLPPHRIIALVGVDVLLSGKSMENHREEILRRLAPYQVDTNAEISVVVYDARTMEGQSMTGELLLAAMNRAIEANGAVGHRE
jgi:hypothetical protein